MAFETAFQPNAFQNDAFQISNSHDGGVSGRVGRSGSKKRLETTQPVNNSVGAWVMPVPRQMNVVNKQETVFASLDKEEEELIMFLIVSGEL